jgi:hypothetical protein
MIEIRPRTGCGENSSVPGTRVLDDLDGCVRTGVGGRSTSAPARCSHSFAGQPRTGASNPPHPGSWNHCALAAASGAARLQHGA